MRWQQWFRAADTDLGHISPWNEVIADRHAATTERMLLGWCGAAHIVGDRVVEARERKLKERREAEARAQLKIAGR